MPVEQDKRQPGLSFRRPDAIVDCRLYVKHDMAHADLRNAAFFADPTNRAHLASQLLLYEHVVIPTNDFGVVPALINWMGLDDFEETLDSGAISFLRRRGILGYGSEGLGLQLFAFTDTPEKPYRAWWPKTLFGDLSEAVELQLKYGVSSLNGKTRDRIAEKVRTKSQAVDLTKDDIFVKHVEKESYTDIRDTPELQAFLSRLAIKLGSKPGDALEMNRLPGIGAAQVRIEIEGESQDPVQLVIKVGEVNMEVILPFGAASFLRRSRAQG